MIQILIEIATRSTAPQVAILSPRIQPKIITDLTQADLTQIDLITHSSINRRMFRPINSRKKLLCTEKFGNVINVFDLRIVDLRILNLDRVMGAETASGIVSMGGRKVGCNPTGTHRPTWLNALAQNSRCRIGQASSPKISRCHQELQTIVSGPWHPRPQMKSLARVDRADPKLAESTTS